MILDLMTAAEPVAARADYTPALIGIGGVIIGGLIQTAFGVVKMRDEQAQKLRADVADFCHDAGVYLGRVQQYVDYARAGHLYKRSDDYRNQALEDVTEKYTRLRASGYRLLASTDQRIASRSNYITEDIAAHSHELSDLFLLPEPGREKPDWPDTRPLLGQVNELATMVEPRLYERHSRFRSLHRAKKLIIKQRKKLQAERTRHGR